MHITSSLSFIQVTPEHVLNRQIEMLTGISFTNVLYAVVILALTYLTARLMRSLLEALGRRAPRSRFFFKMLAPVFRFALWLIGMVLVFSIFSPSRDTLLAVLASAGIALGLGAQDLVKNIIGGLVILIDRPFQLGDRVKIGDAYGEIDHIGLRSTKLTTFDDTRVTIPNKEILSGSAWNTNSGVPGALVVTEVFVPHDADPAELIRISEEAAYTSPFIMLSKPVIVLLQDHFGDGPYMTVRIKAYVYDHRFETRFQSDITKRAKVEFLKRGILLRWSRHDEGPSSKSLRANMQFADAESLTESAVA